MTIQKLYIVAFSTLLFEACDHGGGNSAVKMNGSVQDSGVSHISGLISEIPFPGGIIDTLNSIHARYVADIANAPDNVNLYTESNAQSVNLGVYGADLAYVISLEQFQDVGKYLKNAKILADDIGIPIDFTEEMIVRSENNKNNKDSLKSIVYQGYKVIDQTLKQNQRTASEVLVLVGGWIEGTYLTCQSFSTITDSSDRTKLLNVLYKQQQYSGKLLDLLNSVNSSSFCSQLAGSVKDINDAFEQLQPGTHEQDSFNALNEKIKSLRSLIIKGDS